jgi:hypothetical protein
LIQNYSWMAHTHLPIGLWYPEAFFKDISCCVSILLFLVVFRLPSFSSTQKETCCNIPLEASEDDWIFLYWWSGKDTHSVAVVVDAPGFNLLLSSAWKEREKRRKITFCCYSFQLTGRRNENFKDFIFVVVVVCFSFENEQLIDQPTLKLLGGGLGVAPYASVYMYSRRSSYCS